MSKITGLVCGVRVGDIEDLFMQKVRCLDKLADEPARGRFLERVLRETRVIGENTLKKRC